MTRNMSDDERRASLSHGTRTGVLSTAALTVDLPEPPFSFVTVTGDVEISEDLAEVLPWATAIGARYMGTQQGEQFGRRNAVPGELLVRLVRGRFVAQADIAE